MMEEKRDQLNREWTLPEAVMIFGCGYVGSALARRLLELGVRVGALTRNVEAAAELRALGVEHVIVAELQDAGWHAELTETYDAVVNCVSSAGGGIEGYRKSYVEGQRSILRWTAGREIRRFIYTSSTSVYPQTGGVQVDESSPTDAASATGKVLLESEHLLASSAGAASFERWYVFRLAGIYGPGRHYLLDTLRAHPEAPIPGSGETTLNLIHLEDIVAVILSAISQPDAPESGIYNIADDGAARKKTIVEWLAGELKMPVPTFDPSIQSPRMRRRGGAVTPDRIISNRKANTAFGWQPIYPTFREGYRVWLPQSGS